MDYIDYIATILFAIVLTNPSHGHEVGLKTVQDNSFVGNPSTINPVTDVTKDNTQSADPSTNIATKGIQFSVRDVTSKSTITTTTTEKPTENPSTTSTAASTTTTTYQTTNKPELTTKQTTSHSISTKALPEATTKKSENCMKKGAKEFQACLEDLGRNAMKYITSLNLTGFLDDICDPEQSKPHVECIKRHFHECPDFLNRPEVIALQFGPYHIKDIHYFDTIDQMCRCSPGLVCINKLLETKRSEDLTVVDTKSPWKKMPNYKAICRSDTMRYIGCVRQNLRQCQTALNRRYKDEFTYNDAEDLKGMFDFVQKHCDAVNTDDFEAQFRCINDASRSPEMNACVRKADRLTVAKQTCAVRECAKSILEPRCDAAMMPLYIDAVNIYTHSSTRLLNFPCSTATEIGLSIGTVVFTFLLVLYL